MSNDPRLQELRDAFPVTRMHGGRDWEVAVSREGAGPSILLMHELPGLVPETLEFAGLLVKRGYRVYMPVFFGGVGERLCIRQLPILFRSDIHQLHPTALSPLAHELRGLVQAIRADNEDQPVGVIGMCLTGNFVIALMPEEGVHSAVMSQPSLPFAIGKKRKAALGASDEEIAAAKKSRVPLIGFHYVEDKISPCERFERFKQVFGGQMEFLDLPGNEHSALTIDASEKARDALFAFFEKNLKTCPAAAPLSPSTSPGHP